ncbi:hypothetical protein HDF16_004818 [Granulicella aggregans]|uniref:Uncharacterized protein n=1 Tax=Granulicella aggregans TaxID=474949 RepID=A0A7W7ZHP0_9BACT|nr:hypothetical protein [Granulicella aggregans]
MTLLMGETSAATVRYSYWLSASVEHPTFWRGMRAMAAAG